MEKHEVTDDDKKALGKRLKSCRVLAKMKGEVAAERLGVTKAALSAWETGRNMPDPYMLGKLAKLYGVSVDGILWDNSLSMDAIHFAVQFDALSESQRNTLKTVLMAFVHEGVSDVRVEAAYAEAQRREREAHPMRRSTDTGLMPSLITHTNRRQEDSADAKKERKS